MPQALKRIIFCLVIAVGLTACADSSYRREETAMAVKTIEEVLREHTRVLLALPGVVGTAEGLCGDKPCIKVFVIRKTLDLKQKIPGTLGGYPVEIEETGELRPLPEKGGNKR